MSSRGNVLTNALGYLKNSFARRENLHFLHVGKTGGTAIKHILTEVADDCLYNTLLHEHETSLQDVPVGDRCFFVLRDPCARFVSGFYSRQRQGQPRYLSRWSEAEEVVFGRFETANALAEGLSDEDDEVRLAAEQAMGAIIHVSNHYSDWLVSIEYLESRKDDILMVGFQETLSQDFDRLKAMLNLPEHAALPDDDVAAHRNPAAVDKTLSATAEANLRRWYADDYVFIDYCRTHFSQS